MNKLTMRTSMLGLFTLSAALSVGCAAGSADEGSDPEVGQSQDAIIALGAPIISGCNVSQLFNVTSSQAQDFIAVQGSNLQDLALSLFAVDQFGNQTQIQQAAQATSAAMNSMLSSAQQSSSTLVNSALASSRQIANANTWNSTVASANNLSAASANAYQTDTNVATATHSGNAVNNAYATQASSAFANNANNAFANNTNNAFSNNVAANSVFGWGGGGIGLGGCGIGVCGGVGIAPISTGSSANFLQSLAAANNNFSNAGQNSVMSAAQNSAIASGSATSVNSYDAVTNVHQMAAHSDMVAQNSTNSALYNNAGTIASNAVDTVASNQQLAAQQSSLYNNASNSAFNTANASALNSLAYTNLASQQLQNSHLLVSFNSTSNSARANLFSGSANNVFSNSLFSPVLVGCGL